jgi:hypothetical protein
MSGILGIWVLAGLFALALAVVNERRMQRHRKPGVTYGQATLRRDGGWKRSDLTDEGLAYQRAAAKWGFVGVLLLLSAMAFAWLVG